MAYSENHRIRRNHRIQTRLERPETAARAAPRRACGGVYGPLPRGFAQRGRRPHRRDAPARTHALQRHADLQQAERDADRLRPSATRRGLQRRHVVRPHAVLTRCSLRDQLELAVHLEADRMRNSFIADEDRQSEMTVVRNELERGENEPSNVLHERLWAAAFREHPYHHPTIGWRSDVEGMATSRLKEFYDTFYHPNNATAIIVGDFDESAALDLMSRHFSPIPPSPAPIPQMYTVEPPQEGEIRFALRRTGQLGLINVGWHIPEATAPRHRRVDRARYPVVGRHHLAPLPGPGRDARWPWTWARRLFNSFDPGLFMLRHHAPPRRDTRGGRARRAGSDREV